MRLGVQGKLFLVSVALTVRSGQPQADEARAAQTLRKSTSGEAHAGATHAYP